VEVEQPVIEKRRSGSKDLNRQGEKTAEDCFRASKDTKLEHCSSVEAGQIQLLRPRKKTGVSVKWKE